MLGKVYSCTKKLTGDVVAQRVCGGSEGMRWLRGDVLAQGDVVAQLAKATG
jgi:hypothetical protein